jgi:hypothetical protein
MTFKLAKEGFPNSPAIFSATDPSRIQTAVLSTAGDYIAAFE